MCRHLDTAEQPLRPTVCLTPPRRYVITQSSSACYQFLFISFTSFLRPSIVLPASFQCTSLCLAVNSLRISSAFIPPQTDSKFSLRIAHYQSQLMTWEKKKKKKKKKKKSTIVVCSLTVSDSIHSTVHCCLRVHIRAGIRGSERALRSKLSCLQNGRHEWCGFSSPSYLVTWVGLLES